MHKKIIAMLMLFAYNIIAFSVCRSTPNKIENGRLVGLSAQESKSLEDLAILVVEAKHHKDAQHQNEATELARLAAAKKALKLAAGESQIVTRKFDLEVVENAVTVSKQKTKIAGLELSCSIAEFERQKMRILAAQSKFAEGSEAYETDYESLEKDLTSERAQLERIEKEQSK